MKKKHQETAAQPPEKQHQQEAPEKTSRNVYVFGRLENEVTLPVIKRLLKLGKRDCEKPINLYINSSGGNGYNADAIIATMHSIEAKVNAICLGHALSGACEILASATGERSAYEFATLMFHQTLWEADGDITNLEIQAAQGKRFREAQVELLYRCTGQEKAILRQDIERDHYMSAQQALEYGIIDRIIKHGGANGSSRGGAAQSDSQPRKASLPAAKVNGQGERARNAAEVIKKTRRGDIARSK